MCVFVSSSIRVPQSEDFVESIFSFYLYMGSGDLGIKLTLSGFPGKYFPVVHPACRPPRPIFQGRVLEAESTPPHVPLQSRICCPTPVTFPVWLCPNPQGKDSLTWRIHWADKARSCRPSRLSPGSWTRLRGSGNNNWDLQSKSGLREAG